jgi:hypothetical protein
MKRAFLILALSLLVMLLATPASAVDVQQVQRVLRATHAGWTAGETSVSHLSAEEMARDYCNLQVVLPDGEDAYEEPLDIPQDMPAHLDWRDVGANHDDFTTAIEDQKQCGTCATFSSVGAFEALVKIALNNPFIQPDLSEQAVYSCEGPLPYTFFHPMAYLKKSGAPDMTCYPYHCDNPLDRPPCDGQCADWSVRSFKSKSYRAMMWPTPDQMKAALQNGPIVAGFQVYEDFQAYTGGVYEHKWGKHLGGHGVAVVGYDDAGQYWICKNSWGTGWGEKGWFKIKWGTGFFEFGYQSFAITVEAGILCSDNQAPSIGNLQLASQSEAVSTDGSLPISFTWAALEADLAGGELWSAIDGGAAQRYENALIELTGTSSDGKPATTYTLPGTTEPGDHTLQVWVKDLCGAESNKLSVTFTVPGGTADDDTTPADDDASDDDSSPGGDSSSGDNGGNGGGCGL